LALACLFARGRSVPLFSRLSVGPQYVRPTAPLAPEFKEALPENFKSEDGWKPALPSDSQLKGDWWTLFNDPQLNTLEAEIDPANQTLKQAEANFRAARAAVRFNRASEAQRSGRSQRRRDPRFQQSAILECFRANNGEGNFILPFDLDYEIDLWDASTAPLRRRENRRRPRLPTSKLRGFHCMPS